MSTANEEMETMEAMLDQLEQEHGITDEDLGEGEDLVNEIEEEPAPNPPGYIDNIDDWVAAGKNPDDFKGKNAYKAEYERIKKIDDLEKTLKSTVSTISEWQQKQEQTIRDQILAEMKQAEEDDDLAAFKTAQEKLKDIPQAAPKVNPVINEFTAKNPIIDANSSQFDKDFFDDMSMMHNSTINQLTGGDPKLLAALTPAQIERSMTVAYNRAKGLHPGKFKSAKNQRQGAPSGQQRTVATAPDNRLSSVARNSHNKRDTNPGQDIYEMLKAKDPKAAETFKKNVLGEQS